MDPMLSEPSMYPQGTQRTVEQFHVLPGVAAAGFGRKGSPRKFSSVFTKKTLIGGARARVWIQEMSIRACDPVSFLIQATNCQQATK